jgi:FAD/FMN-containing dehydrogenase
LPDAHGGRRPVAPPRANDRWFYIIGGNCLDPDELEPARAWIRQYDAAFEQHRSPGRYVNFFAEDDDQAMREAFGKDRYAQLMEIKAQYDPNGVFSYGPNSRRGEQNG